MYTGFPAVSIRTRILGSSGLQTSFSSAINLAMFLQASAKGSSTRGITSHALALGGDAGHVGAVGDVPHVDVLLHAAGQTGALLRRKGATRGGNAGVEAVLVDFLLSLALVLRAKRKTS